MKICRDINYNDFGITEENGWKVSYDWEKLRKIFKKFDIAIPIFCALLGRVLAQTTTIFNYGIISILLCVAAAVFIFIFILTPIHEILHLIPLAGFKLDNKCYIIIGKVTVSAFYTREITNKQNCVSLITPFIVLGLIITLIIIFSSGILKTCAIIILMLHVGGSYRDIFMFFYLIKNFSSKTIFYGNRYRI